MGETSVERRRRWWPPAPDPAALQQEGTPLDQNQHAPELRHSERCSPGAEANLRRQSRWTRANASGQLARQMVTAWPHKHCLFLVYLAAAFICWPRSVWQTTRERVLEAGSGRLLEDDELEPESIRARLPHDPGLAELARFTPL